MPDVWASGHVVWKLLSTHISPSLNIQAVVDCLEDKRKDYQNCSVLCCVRLLCISDMQTCEQFLKWTVGLGLGFYRFKFAFCVFFLPLCSCVVCFCCVRFSFFSTKPRDWLGRMSPT